MPSEGEEDKAAMLFSSNVISLPFDEVSAATWTHLSFTSFINIFCCADWLRASCKFPSVQSNWYLTFAEGSFCNASNSFSSCGKSLRCSSAIKMAFSRTPGVELCNAFLSTAASVALKPSNVHKACTTAVGELVVSRKDFSNLVVLLSFLSINKRCALRRHQILLLVKVFTSSSVDALPRLILLHQFIFKVDAGVMRYMRPLSEPLYNAPDLLTSSLIHSGCSIICL